MKTLQNLTTCIAIVLLSLNFSSCGNDDENDAKSLWGTWIQIEEDNHHWVWEFKPNGDFYAEKYINETLDGTEKGTYTCTKDAEGGIIILSPWPDTEYHILSISENKMTVEFEDSGRKLYFNKQ